MTAKRIIIVLIFAVLVLIANFLWSNILILDDKHPASTQVIQGYYSIGSSYQIIINLDELTMYVYKSDELLAEYPVSGGSPYTPSPLGDWIITSKDTWGEGFGGAWLGFNVPWGAYGIHKLDTKKIKITTCQVPLLGVFYYLFWYVSIFAKSSRVGKFYLFFCKYNSQITIFMVI